MLCLELAMTEGTHQERKTSTRRQVLCCAGGGVLGFAAGWLARGHQWTSPASEAPPENAQQALARLREGNQPEVTHP